LKIALVTPYFPPNIGGIETYVCELANRLAKDNDVYVFTCGRGIVETRGRVTIFRLRALDVQNLPVSPKIPYPIPSSMMFKIARSNVDVIHAHGHAFMTSFHAALASRITHKPFVLTVHDIGVAYRDYRIMRGIRPIVDSTLVNFIFKHSDVVIAQNNVTYRYSLRFNPKNIVIIPQGIDCQRFSPAEDGEYVTFFAARLVPQKGGEIFIRAVPHVLEQIGDAKFRVIGDGYQRSFLENLSKKLGVRDHIDFSGRVPHELIPSYLGTANVVVFPSEIPTGLSLLEAAAMRKPIITTDNEWARDALGDAPLYIPGRSPAETAEAIIHLLSNPEERTRMSQLAYDKVIPERDWNSVVSKHLELYDNIVKNGAA